MIHHSVRNASPTRIYTEVKSQIKCAHLDVHRLGVWKIIYYYILLTVVLLEILNQNKIFRSVFRHETAQIVLL